MRSAVFLASWFISLLRFGVPYRRCGQYTASAKNWQDPAVCRLRPADRRPLAGMPAGRRRSWPLFPSRRPQALVERGEGLARRRHQPAEALLDQLLDIVGVDMRVAAGHA